MPKRKQKRARRRPASKPRRGNPAFTAAQYGAAQAVLSGASNIMPKAVARDLVKLTPARKRSQFMQELARRRNPKGSRRRRNQEDFADQQAASMYEKFHGRPPRSIRTIEQIRVTPSSLADCGRLVELEIRRPGERDVLKFNNVRVGTTTNGGQLYFVGGDQAVDVARLVGDQLPKDHVWLGTAHRIVYFTSKAFHKFEPSEYSHKFGEEGGERPELAYDVHSRRLYLVGGSYRVTPEGIVD